MKISGESSKNIGVQAREYKPWSKNILATVERARQLLLSQGKDQGASFSCGDAGLACMSLVNGDDQVHVEGNYCGNASQ